MSTDKFGRYIIKGEIGHGGMATVFHAYDPSFERDVAIKVLPREFMFTPHFRTRFEREAKMIALLEHPTIVPVYDFGDEDGQPYIVMRYMSGGSLADRLERGLLSVKETLNMINRLASALDAAHLRGIIHRDLKPGNILYDQYGNAFLSDFGIARLTQSTGTTITGWTILGTPAYMSPERVQGDREEVDNRSDIYALGVILYQTLTGQLPYDSENPAKVMMMHILEPVPSILSCKPDLPAAFEFVIEKAMAKNPEDRYLTAGDLALAVEVAVQNDPNRPPSTPLPTPEGNGAKSTHPPSTTTLAMPMSQLDEATEATTAVEASSKISEAVPTKPSRLGILNILLQRLSIWRQSAKSLPDWRLLVSGTLIIILLGVLAAGGFTKGGLFSFLNRQTATSSTQPGDGPQSLTPASITPLNSTSVTTPNTPIETSAPTPVLPVIGGANQIAFISNNDIWVANMDGSASTRLTEDGAAKLSLQWTSNGQALVYTSAACVRIIDLVSKTPQTITCFQGIQSLDFFEIAPDGSQIAVGFDQKDLYILPYQADQLTHVQSLADLKDLASCDAFAPLGGSLYPKAVRWSANGQRLALIDKGPDENNERDAISIIDLSQCTASPPEISALSSQLFLFTLRGYSANPQITTLSWDGRRRLVLNTSSDDAGDGDLYVYDTAAYTGTEINPVGGACCYRDARWSPDGRYLLFAYRDGRTDKIGLYYTLFDSDTLLQLPEKFPLPDDLFTNSRSHPQPVLRPAGP